MSAWSSRRSGASPHGGETLREAFSLATAMVLSLAVGCAPAVPSFPPLPVDAGIECGPDLPCPTGQTCLQGMCFAACDAMHACGPRESCVAGVCVLRVGDAGPLPDASSDASVMRDAPMDSPPDPCIAARCMTPTPLCRPGGLCVECNDASTCGGGFPICDVGRGRCVAFRPAYCAACNTDLDCRTPAGIQLGRCVARADPEPNEHVCMPTCTATIPCPSGFRCDLGRLLCLPLTESCTGYDSGITARACAGDPDCAQIGATVDTGLISGACSDDGTGRVCHYACGLPTDCPAPLACAMDFCRP